MARSMAERKELLWAATTAASKEPHLVAQKAASKAVHLDPHLVEQTVAHWAEWRVFQKAVSRADSMAACWAAN
jgi:hypothetical protein